MGFSKYIPIVAQPPRFESCMSAALVSPCLCGWCLCGATNLSRLTIFMYGMNLIDIQKLSLHWVFSRTIVSYHYLVVAVYDFFSISCATQAGATRSRQQSTSSPDQGKREIETRCQDRTSGTSRESVAPSSRQYPFGTVPFSIRYS